MTSATDSNTDFGCRFSTLKTLDSVRWSITIEDDKNGQLYVHNPDELMSTASVPKVLLLVEVAEQLASGTVLSDEVIHRSSTSPVGGSGLWQHLDSETLPLLDVASLVGSVSDNVATNALLGRVGLEAVQSRANKLSLKHTTMLDLIRNHRSPSDPDKCSQGTSRELVNLIRMLNGDAGSMSEPVRNRVVNWLRLSKDHSMVASAFGLDPLSHYSVDRGYRLWNKTGTDAGVRAEMGYVGGEISVSYAAIANWDEELSPSLRDDVLGDMKRIGELIRNG